MPNDNDQNKRTSPRLPVLLAVAYKSGGELVRDVITNLSEGGLFIRTTRPLPIGTEVVMAIAIADEPPINQAGRVTWARGMTGEGMGIRFVPPVDEQLTALLRPKPLGT